MADGSSITRPGFLPKQTRIPRSANIQNDARADIKARGFWGRRQCAFFDVRVFHPNAQSNRHSSIQSLYRKHEQIKKREYGNRVREVEYASFTPLVLATSGGMGREATMFYKRMADTLSTKNNAHYYHPISSYVYSRKSICCTSHPKFHNRIECD